jgi:peroxiredoxin (alkyl hydroperoxide reductase subunit C)
MNRICAFLSALFVALFVSAAAFAISEQYQGRIYQPGHLKPVDSMGALKVGDKAPDFTLPSLSGTPVSLSAFAGKKNVVISFVPAAWTPVCSEQWPGYNLLRAMFEAKNAVMLGVTVDNIPTLFAWTTDMGEVWFPVLSDFWPHGEVARKYGVLRSNGVSERALFVIDRKGVIRYIDVHDINERPKMETLMAELDKLDK